MAPFKMPVMMWNMTTFPIERLCFDLKLKVLGQLDARDVIELVKVNQGFQWMISNRPSIVFGHQLLDIHLGFDPDRIDPHGMPAININKLNSESLWVSLDIIRHFPFTKNIRSCDLLIVDNGFNEDYATFLKQLEAVNSLYLNDYSPVSLDLLSHLSSKIKIKIKDVSLPSFFQKTPSIKDLVEHFIATQLNECEIVRVRCSNDDEIQFYYNTFVKTHIKYVVMRGYNADIIIPAIQRIVNHGIPSKNPAAVVRVYGEICFWDDMESSTIGNLQSFLTGYPGMRKIRRKNRRPFIALANDHRKGSGDFALTMKTLCLRRNINAARDCIYMLSSKKFELSSKKFDGSIYIYFFSFYIKPDEMIDH